jgi:HEAT repeat protein
MSSDKPLLPALKPKDWQAKEDAICQPLVVDQESSYMPWLAFGYDLPHTFQFLSANDLHEGASPRQIDLMKQAALRNLRERPARWQTENIKLGLFKRLRMLLCTGDYLAAERILDDGFMLEAHKLLKTEMLAVGIPRRGLLLATNTNGPKEHLKRFGAAVSAQYHRADSPPITPLLFLVVEGQIVGLVKGMEESAREAVQAESEEAAGIYCSAMITEDQESGDRTLHIIAGGEDLTAVARAVQNAFIQIMQKMKEERNFSGEVYVVLVSDLTPRTEGLDEELESIGKHLEGFAKEVGLTTARGAPIRFKMQYGQDTAPGAVSASDREVPLDSDDLDSLIKGLAHHSPQVRKVAAEWIEQKGDQAGIPPLVQALGDGNPEVQAAVAKALSAFGEVALDPLHAGLKNGDLRTRTSAAELLGRMANPKSVRPLILAFGDDELQVRTKAAESLVKIGEPAILDLTTAFEKGKDVLREFSLEALIAVDSKRFGHLLPRAIHDPFPGVRRRATYFLAKLADPDHFEPLMRLTQDEDPNVRQLAVSGLTRLADPRSADRLRAMVSDDPDGTVRGKAALALGQLREARAVPQIVPLLEQGSNSIIRAYAAKALGEIGDPSALEALIDAMDDSHEIVQGAAASAIRKFGKAAVKPLRQAQKALKWEQREQSRILVGLIADCRLGKKY